MATELKFEDFSVSTNTPHIEFEVGYDAIGNYRRASYVTAATDPTASSDSTLGFAVGSRWFNATLGRLWMCQDATAAAAVWKCLTQDNGFQSITVAEGGEIQLAAATGFVNAGGTGSVDETTIKLPASPYLGKTVSIAVIYPVTTNVIIANLAGASQFSSEPITNTFAITMICTNATTNTWSCVGIAYT